MRKEKFENGEIYHIYNQGVDKRDITLDRHDSDRFVQGLQEFNTTDPIGSLHWNACKVRKLSDLVAKKLVEIIAYCLNPNHFHLILRQIHKNGISIFLKAQCGGYSSYFNKRHQRGGTLFRGPFKAKWIEDKDELLYKSVYVNRNNEVHKISDQVAKERVRRSWEEYMEGKGGLCVQMPVLKEFNGTDAYIHYANSTLKEIREAKQLEKELKSTEFED